MEANDAEFIAALLLYQHRQDNALGLYHVTTRQRGLLWYYNTMQLQAHKSYQALMEKSFHLGVMKGIRRRMRKIKQEIKATPDKAQALYSEYLVLQKQFEASIRVIDG